MKTKLIMLMMLCISSLNAQNKLTIVVDGIENIQGTLIAGIYNSETFLKKPLDGKFISIDENTVSMVFDNLETGDYAISLFQDENDNKKLDTNSYGMPIEKYGFSNNAKGKMGPPIFNDCKFHFEEDTTIYITIN